MKSLWSVDFWIEVVNEGRNKQLRQARAIKSTKHDLSKGVAPFSPVFSINYYVKLLGLLTIRCIYYLLLVVFEVWKDLLHLFARYSSLYKGSSKHSYE